MKSRYPDDGLKEPIKSFDECFDGFKMILKYWKEKISLLD